MKRLTGLIDWLLRKFMFRFFYIYLKLYFCIKNRINTVKTFCAFSGLRFINIITYIKSLKTKVIFSQPREKKTSYNI